LDKLKAYLLGRAKRPEYWISVVILTIGTMALNVILRNPPLASTISFLPWIVISGRRLRDFGWSPWWCLSTVVSGAVVGFVIGFVNAIAAPGIGHALIPPAGIMIACGVVSWIIIIYIGSRNSVAATRLDARTSQARDALAETFD
jgi:uncharacterized membrane protein YhaH (DUF805 family)